jgi:ABC transport system ATP-binding/permease protein
MTYAIGNRTLFEDVSFAIMSGTRVGLVGPNGSGKTTLLRLLKGELQPSRGQIREADGLRITYFDQNRQLDPDVLLRRALAPDSDSVIYQGQVIHVASWAARFLFSGEDLNQPVGRLSGGERARILIAQLMLHPADVLLLDEPTNDLDIPTLEILEESLLEYRGALVLVTHDRYLLDRISTLVLGLDGLGKVEGFADYTQWDAWRQSRQAKGRPDGSGGSQRSRSSRVASPPAVRKKKLSYGEAREFATIEQRIAAAEQDLHAKRSALEDPAITGDVGRLRRICDEMGEAQKTIDYLYARWAELEKKQD